MQPTSANTEATSATPNSSKEFAEHLRAVHFTLLATSFALLVIASSSAPQRISKAKEQLTQIWEATQTWNDDWVWNADKLAKQSGECKKDTFQPILIDLNGEVVRLKFVDGWQFKSPKDLTIYSYGGVGFVHPSTLEDFRKQWDSSYEEFCPRGIEHRFFIREGFEGSWKTKELQGLPSGGPQVEVPVQLELNRVEALYPGELPKYYVQRGQYVFGGKLGVQNPNPTFILIPIMSGEVKTFTVRDSIAKALPKYEWRHSEFKDAFYELDQATTGFQNLPFAIQTQILHAQEKAAGPEFEAFGQKFPVESTARWGILLILGIQVYFWLHLREYRRRKFLGSEVAWIGTYSGWLPRLVFYATSLLLPLYVTGSLLFGHRERPYSAVVSAALLCLMSAVAGLCWYEHKNTRLV